MKFLSPQLKGSFVYGRFQIPYRVFGSGEDIICLNGAQQSMAMWFSLLRHFRNRYRITLFDFPHQGKAQVNYGPVSVSLQEQVDILRAVIEEIGIKTATICSASWGGVIALLFAVRFPQHTKRLILASIGLRPNNLMRDVILKGTQMSREDREKMAGVIINNFGDSLPEEVKGQIVRQFQTMQEEQIRAFSEHGMSVVSAGSLDKVVPLSKITTSTTVLYGENDKIIDLKDVQALPSLIPNCEIKIIPNTGHFLHLENEKVFGIYEEILESEPAVI